MKKSCSKICTCQILFIPLQRDTKTTTFNNGKASRKVTEFMKQQRFRIHPTRDYVIHVSDNKNRLITTIRDNDYYSIQQIIRDAWRVCYNSPQKAKYITISCEETGEWGMYTMKGTKIL